MKIQFCLLLLAMLGLSACGKNKPKGPPSNTKLEVPVPTKVTEEQIQSILDNQFFECASIDGGPCPEGIARLLIIDKENAESMSVCSGFMINQNTLVTNQHCIPDEKTCKHTYIAIYNGYYYEQVRCLRTKVVMKDYLDPNDPRKKLDVAVIETDLPYYGATFEAATDKVLPNDSVTAWVIDHTGIDRAFPNASESRITELKCTVSHQTERKSLILDKCPVIKGNSGSPVLNQEGKVIGVVWGASSDANSTSSLEIRRSLSEEAALTEVGYFERYFKKPQ